MKSPKPSQTVLRTAGLETRCAVVNHHAPRSWRRHPAYADTLGDLCSPLMSMGIRTSSALLVGQGCDQQSARRPELAAMTPESITPIGIARRSRRSSDPSTRLFLVYIGSDHEAVVVDSVEVVDDALGYWNNCIRPSVYVKPYCWLIVPATRPLAFIAVISGYASCWLL
jgi:hypothetical protein